MCVLMGRVRGVVLVTLPVLPVLPVLPICGYVAVIPRDIILEIDMILCVAVQVPGRLL